MPSKPAPVKPGRPRELKDPVYVYLRVDRKIKTALDKIVRRERKEGKTSSQSRVVSRLVIEASKA